MRRSASMVALVLSAAPFGSASAQDPVALNVTAVPTQYTVKSGLIGKKGKTAKDISGIACMPGQGEQPRTCLVINDENREAQFVTIDKATVTPGKTVPLIGREPDESTRGAKPTQTKCPNNAPEFTDLDGEGVAYAEPYFYVAGSHGCSRNSGEFHLSAFILARFRVDGHGNPVGLDGKALAAGKPIPVETTYRLSDALLAAPPVAPFFGKKLQTEGGNTAEEPNGLNLEGVAVIGDRLFAGLRAPSINGGAFIVAGNVNELFAKELGSPLKTEVIELKLGKNAGIRDLTRLADDKLLGIAGPAQKQADVPYSLFIAEAKTNGVLRMGKIPDLTDPEELKPEAVVALAPDRVLILFDGAPNGGPREYKID